MPRLIDADALADRLDAVAYDDWNQGVNTSWADAFKAFAEMVRDERTVDPIEWINEHSDDYFISGIEQLHLSEMLDAWEKENG